MMPLLVVAHIALASANPTVITMPDWAAKPHAEDFSKAYPAIALMLAFDGRATLRCQVSKSGALEACAVDDESPAGLGFGKAALTVAAKFRMKPVTVNGKPVAGGTVRIPLSFQAGPPSDFDAGRKYQPPKSTLDRKVLARSIMTREPVASLVNEQRETVIAETNTTDYGPPPPGENPQDWGAAQVAIAKFSLTMSDKIQDLFAAEIASRYSEQQLRTSAGEQNSTESLKMFGQILAELDILGLVTYAALYAKDTVQAEYCRGRPCENAPENSHGGAQAGQAAP